MCAKRNVAAAVNIDKKTALLVRQQESDAPFLPVDELERLHRFRPDTIDWVLERTDQEIDWRRSQIEKTNSRIFLERILGQILGAIIGLSGVIGGIIAIYMKSAWAGGIIATVAIGTLAVAFVRGGNTK